MNISKLIKTLIRLKREGYKSIKFQDFNLPHSIAKFEDMHYLSREVFIRLDNHKELEKLAKKSSSMFFNDEAEEGLHYAIIKSKILSFEIRELSGACTNGYETIFILEPMVPLPKWFDKDDYYDYFENVEIGDIMTHDEYFLLPSVSDYLQ